MNINLGLSALATGTVDAITATYSPAPTLVDKKILFLRTLGANTIAAPTFSPNSLAAHPITKNGGQALVPGDLLGDVILMYDLANTRWELLTAKSLGPVRYTYYIDDASTPHLWRLSIDQTGQPVTEDLGIA
jgi:hypothetical protein